MKNRFGPAEMHVPLLTRSGGFPREKDGGFSPVKSDIWSYARLKPTCFRSENFSRACPNHYESGMGRTQQDHQLWTVKRPSGQHQKRWSEYGGCPAPIETLGVFRKQSIRSRQGRSVWGPPKVGRKRFPKKQMIAGKGPSHGLAGPRCKWLIE